MIREVYINNQLIDIESDNVAGFIFSSPIFRDISKITSNRSTTYKIPKTTKNLAIFGLADNPDVIFTKEDTKSPYREHSFKEDRDGLPFISGVCYYLKTSEKEIELAVFWGNSEKLQALKDAKLRDLRWKEKDYKDDNGNEIQGFRYLYWGEGQGFLPATKKLNSGFLKVDFGKGVGDIRNVHPCVNVQYILDLIKSSTGISIDYPDEFKDEFSRKWFPLVSKTANSITWDQGNRYHVNAHITAIDVVYPSRVGVFRFGDNDNHIIKPADYGSVIVAKQNSIVEVAGSFLVVRAKTRPSVGEYEMKLIATRYIDGNVYDEKIVEMRNDNDGYVAVFNLVNNPISFKSSNDENICLKALYRLKNQSDNWKYLGDDFEVVQNPTTSGFRVSVKYEEVQFGDRYPIINNLPDLSVIDFLKSLMSMYGLFTYHNFKVAPDTVKFVSIDEMFSYKKDAYDWTNKLILINGSQMRIEYTYGEYARKNKLKYKNDKDVSINADGYIEVDNQMLTETKDLVELPYSPSHNTADEFGNKFAIIPLYDNEGNYSSVGVRILNEGEYYKEGQGALKSASFDEFLYFSGIEGLIKTFYSKYQAVMLYPIVIECSAYLSDVELHQFSENNAVYIDGVYYMPITVTVQTNGITNCKLIKMPYIED